MTNNCEEQFQWFRNNKDKAKNAGFLYDPTILKNYIKPQVFNFDNAVRASGRNCTLASVSHNGQLDLEIFRQHDSSYSPQKRKPMTNNNSFNNLTNAQTNFQIPNPIIRNSNSNIGQFQEEVSHESHEIDDKYFLDIDVDGKFTMNSGI